ncbi:MAG: hypothetical protein R3324_10510, partial [Halobacteriales archaeon]|nr:hypothetical protein [Halobacteriales archaeon]
MPDSMSEMLRQDMSCDGLLECFHDTKELDKVVFELAVDAEGPLTVDEIADGIEPDTPEPESVTNRISPRCGNCPYHDLCYTNAVESEGLELLGIAEGT